MNIGAPQKTKSSTLSLKNKQSKTSDKATLKPTDHEFIENQNSYILNALICSRDDPFNNMKVPGITTPGNKTAELASNLFNMLKDNADLLSEVATEIVSYIAEIYSSTNFKLPSHREKLWSEILSAIKFDYNQIKLFDIAFRHFRCEDSIFRSLYFTVCSKVLLSIVQHVNESKNVDDEVVDLQISKEEKQVVYYVAGFIVYALLKKYDKALLKKSTDSMLISLVRFLRSLKSNDKELCGESINEYVRKWTKLVNRGGLVLVRDEMYLFIEHIELLARKVLNVKFIRKYKGQDLRDVIQQEINSSDKITEAWLILMRNCPHEEFILELKDQIILKWIDLRANSFVKSYVQVIKRKVEERKSSKKAGQTLSSSSEPALRKTLN